MRTDLVRCPRGHFHLSGQACKPRPEQHTAHNINGLVRFTLDLRLPKPLYDWMLQDADRRMVGPLHRYVGEVLEVWITSRGDAA